jgi:hypothetical protein
MFELETSSKEMKQVDVRAPHPPFWVKLSQSRAVYKPPFQSKLDSIKLTSASHKYHNLTVTKKILILIVEMRCSIVIFLAFVASVSALPALTTTPINPAEVTDPQNGDIVSECNDSTQLGDKSCLGTGFITCTHRGNIFRPCGAGTHCVSLGENNLTCE